MLEALITVIPKPGKDERQCGSYRPISLLNVDLKLFIGILASRLSQHLPGLIDPDQSGFVPNRQCSDNTKCLLHLIDRSERFPEERMILSVDAEKAFDRVHWPYLRATLEHFGIPPRFIDWVFASYATPTATVRVNGIASPPPHLQGDDTGVPVVPPSVCPVYGAISTAYQGQP